MNSIGNRDNLQSLKDLLYESVPKLKLIQVALSEIHPGILAVEIEKDVGFAYFMDYYFKLLDKFTIRAIFQHPSFSQEALTELFYCQITAIHKAKLLNKPIPELFSSYWSYLSKPQYAALLKNTLSRTWNLEPAKALLSRIDLVHIKMLTKSGTIDEMNILNLFKSLGSDIKKVFSEDINLYDYAFGLAADASDIEFLNFLESYTMLFVQLRIASSFVIEIEKLMETKGEKLSFPELFKFFANVPKDTIEVCLEIFSDKGWLSKNESEKIFNSYADKR
jgi:hypothetical protein